MKALTLLVMIVHPGNAFASSIPVPPLPPIPANLADPATLPAATQRAVAESFRQIRNENAAAQPKASLPALPALPMPPAVAPPAPRFSPETLAKIDASFSPLALRSPDLASLSDESFVPVRSAPAEEVAPAAEAAPVQVAEVPSAPKPKITLSPYLNLAEDPVDPASAVGMALAQQRMASSGDVTEDTLFSRVSARYREREQGLLRIPEVAGR